MLYFDRNDVSEGIDVNKLNKLKGWDICFYWHLLNKDFKLQPSFCNRCHGLLMMSKCTLVILLFETLKAVIITVLLAAVLKVRP